MIPSTAKAASHTTTTDLDPGSEMQRPFANVVIKPRVPNHEHVYGTCLFNDSMNASAFCVIEPHFFCPDSPSFTKRAYSAKNLQTISFAS